MAEFLVEVYVPQSGGADVPCTADRAQRAADELSGAGMPVRCLRAIFVPEDETCLFLYEAESADAVRQAATRAGLAFERVADVLVDRRPSTGRSALPASPPLTRKEMQ